MSTPYHAKYFSHLLTRQGGVGVERLSRSLFDACVDLNPHQIEAALFSIRSPLSKGVLLADEVGLGKTIEAGLVLCEFWAEQKRRLLVICPASIRKQWALELEEKFNLPSKIIDAKSYRESVLSGNPTPFVTKEIVITSTHFASRKASEIRLIKWDIVVIDEAHKLRNAYRKSNRMGQNIRWALEDSRKILLTATPLQNSLLELYGLSTIIDERIFGELPSFRTQYISAGSDLDGLRNRLLSYCFRTLRSQVVEYIQFTERKLITRPFQPTEHEHKLYEAISGFLKRDDTYALPSNQRHLITLIVRKLLASSSQAVAGTLETMRDRLIALRDNLKAENQIAEKIIQDEEIEDEILDEILEEEVAEEEKTDKEKQQSFIDYDKLNAEINELDKYVTWARSIGIDTKTKSLLKALEIGFKQMVDMGAKQKAVIFTESRRTQAYLKDFLEANGYAGKVVTFNGTNREPESTAIYERWLETNKDTGRIAGSRQINIRTAIIEHFKNEAMIMIATEAAAEGINLQFCSLVINFDLPWNPQRVEQRIGRCHRYGQKHDVVVINFLVYELLNEKFNLFTGVFGASDEILGSIESGVDFEKRILEIYQECRTPEEIEAAFQKLREELDERIKTRMDDTRRLLLEHFDEDVHQRLKVNLTGTREQLDRVGKMFWSLTKFVLREKAEFDENEYRFLLKTSPTTEIRTGNYHLISKNHHNIRGEFLYRLSHPLGEYVIQQGKELITPSMKVTFDITNHPTRIAVIEDLKGKKGWLMLQHLVIESYEREDYLLFSAFDDNGKIIDQETCEKLFNCNGIVKTVGDPDHSVINYLEKEVKRHVEATISRSLEQNNRHFNEARERLEKWADDMILAAEQDLKDTKQQIKLLNRQARLAVTTQEQHELQEKIKELELKKRRQRQRIFDIEDEIIEKRDKLIDNLEKRMTQKTSVKKLFTIRWHII